MFYGFDYIEYLSMQLPSTVYQNTLKYVNKTAEGYTVPYFKVSEIKDITIVEETKDFGDNIQSQLTMTVNDGSLVNIYFTVLYDDSGANLKFLDVEIIG